VLPAGTAPEFEKAASFFVQIVSEKVISIEFVFTWQSITVKGIASLLLSPRFCFAAGAKGKGKDKDNDPL
jgi:hypothetical protein